MTDFPALEDMDFSSPTGGAGTGGGGGSFLEREAALLGDDAAAFRGTNDANAVSGLDDFDKSAAAFPDLTGGGADDFGALSGGGGSGGGGGGNNRMSFDGFGSPPTSARPPPASDNQPLSSPGLGLGGGFGNGSPGFGNGGQQPVGGVSVTGHDEIGAFESAFPEIDPTAGEQNGYQQQAQQLPPTLNTQPSYSSGGYNIAPIEEETEPIKEWRSRQTQEIAQRDEASLQKHEEIIAKAEKAIDDFYRDYNIKKERDIARNKEEEEAFSSSRTDALARGTTWERISTLIDLQDSRSKTNTKSVRDLGRMKELILSLKREGETAPGAGGY